MMNDRPVTGLAMSLPPVLFLIGFVGIPVVLAVLYSLGDLHAADTSVTALALHQVVAKHGLTPAVYAQLLTSRAFLQDLWATIWTTLTAVAVVLGVGWAIAMYTRFSRGWTAKVFSVLCIVPMFVPVVIASYALVSFYSDGGFLSSLLYHLGDRSLQMPSYTLSGVVVAQVWVNIPFAVLLLSSGLKGIPDAHIEAAKDVGASWPSVVWSVLLPQNMLSTIIVAAFSIIGIMGSFTVPYLTGPNAPQLLGVATLTYFQTYEQPQQAQAMAVMLFVMSMAVAYFYVRSNMRADRKEGVL